MTVALARALESFAAILRLPVASVPGLSFMDSQLVCRVHRGVGGDTVTRWDGTDVHRYLFLGESGLWLLERTAIGWLRVPITSGTQAEVTAWIRQVVDTVTMVDELRDLPAELIDEVRTRSLRRPTRT